MFRSLAGLLPADAVFTVHPFQLSRWLEEAWSDGRALPAFGPRTTGALPLLGDDAIVSALDLPQPIAGQAQPLPSGINAGEPGQFSGSTFVGTVPLTWDHLSYAYCIESTGVIEVMAEVVRRLVVGESLNVLTAPGVQWVRATEELFFREPPLFSISGVVSELRPESRVTRRNSYWRMFGLDLPHPVPERSRRPGFVDQTWRADTGDGVNTGFREKWTELLRQVWLGFENSRNGIGPNATDREYVAFLCQALRDMMTMRRRGGQLAREEFVHVTTMSWFHLTLETDTPIVKDLKAEATNPADRLVTLAQRVGMTPAPRARELFELADLMSALLRAIEVGLFDTGQDAETLYLPLAGNEALVRDVNRIIDLWQSATGDRVKDRPAGQTAQPVRLPSPSTAVLPVMAPRPAPTAAQPMSVPDRRAAMASMNGNG
jgi:hypothetical protein